MKIEISLGLANILTIIFIILKIFHLINWSWWVVFSPSILLFLLPMSILGGLFMFLLIVEFFN